VLAHPERNRAVQADPGRLGEAVRLGALVQVTAASVDGRIGRSSQKAADRLLESGLAHVLASDAHTPEIREAGLADAAEAVGDDRLATFLTAEAPAAIVAGEAVPDPPRKARRRRYILF
jgi:protein-tyrosine phosphatase